MAEVKWVKITTDMFDNRKIKHLRKLPEGNNIVLIWVMLLTMAGRCNAGGMIFLTENIPYTPKMLADELGFEENTVKLALQFLEQFSMIQTDQGYFSIAGWNEYQNIEGMDKIREQNRLRKQKQRERQKALPEPSRDITGQVTQNHAIDKEEDKDIEKEKKKKKSDKESPRTLFERLISDYAMTDALKAKMCEWITYKTERKEPYKETGLKSLLRQVEGKAAEYGDIAVIDLIDLCMASSWKGIIFDKLKAAPGQAQPIRQTAYQKKPSKAEEMDEFYNMAASWAADGG
jgi:predicted phage replisome organizer